MPERVSWDERKATSNWRKHGVRFEEARTIFYDPLVLSFHDPRHAGEERFVAIGSSISGELRVVAYAIRDDEPWIINARHAERVERRRYMDKDRSDEALDTDSIPTIDFGHGVRGRHYIAPRGPIQVEIDAVVAEFYRDEKSVNDALRMLIAEGRSPEPLPR
ncbi:MAG TPA: BrnT family toxin [Thermoanaerobaculia bacterium]